MEFIILRRGVKVVTGAKLVFKNQVNKIPEFLG